MLRRCALASSATSADAALRRQDVLRVSHGAGTAAASRSGTRGVSRGSTWQDSKIDHRLHRERGARARFFDLSVCVRPGPSEVAGGREKTKTENRKQKGGGAGARHEKSKKYPLGP